jgi:transcriptional regulator with XRE-family HTH domain
VIAIRQIGKQAADARRLRKLAQLDVAHKAGVSLRTVSLLENGRASDLGYSKLVRILAAVGLELRLEQLASERPTLDDLLREDAGDD